MQYSDQTITTILETFVKAFRLTRWHKSTFYKSYEDMTYDKSTGLVRITERVTQSLKDDVHLVMATICIIECGPKHSNIVRLKEIRVDVGALELTITSPLFEGERTYTVSPSIQSVMKVDKN